MITIELPLPHISLHPNSRPHYLNKARQTKKARAEAGFMAKQCRDASCPWKAAILHATFHMPRKRDDDGLVAWIKPLRDGLQDAGLVTNDSQIRVGNIEQVTGRSAGRKVVLRLERVE